MFFRLLVILTKRSDGRISFISFFEILHFVQNDKTKFANIE